MCLNFGDSQCPFLGPGTQAIQIQQLYYLLKRIPWSPICHLLEQYSTQFFSFSSFCSHCRRLAYLIYLIQISVHAEYSLKNWIFFEKLFPVNFTPRRITNFFFILTFGNTFMSVNPYVCWLSLSFFLSSLFSCLLFKSNSIFLNIECHQF